MAGLDLPGDERVIAVGFASPLSSLPHPLVSFRLSDPPLNALLCSRRHIALSRWSN